MKNIFLYVLCVLIWGCTWFAITFQLGAVAPEVAIFYRFLVSAIASFAICIFLRKSLVFKLKEHFWIFLQGATMFCGSYIFTYYSEIYVNSAIVALTFTVLIYFNTLGMRVFYGKKIELRIIGAGIIGVIGVFLIFYEPIMNSPASKQAVTGMILALVATVISSLGNMASVMGRKNKLPVLESNTWSMLYGALLTGLLALLLGRNFVVNLTTPFVLSFLYLTIFGTVIAFYAYVTLIETIGPERAAYSGVITPVIALIISSLFESFTWHPLTFVGIALCLSGNIIVLQKQKA